MSEFKIQRVDVVQNPSNQQLEPMIYFVPDQEFINLSERNNNILSLDISGTDYYSGKGIFAIIDKSSVVPNCRANFYEVTDYYVAILRNTPWKNHPNKLGSFTVSKAPIVAKGVNIGNTIGNKIAESVENVENNQPRPKYSLDDLLNTLDSETSNKSLSKLDMSLIIIIIVLIIVIVFGAFLIVRN